MEYVAEAVQSEGLRFEMQMGHADVQARVVREGFLPRISRIVTNCHE
jgi:hypothetical protein